MSGFDNLAEFSEMESQALAINNTSISLRDTCLKIIFKDTLKDKKKREIFNALIKFFSFDLTSPIL